MCQQLTFYKYKKVWKLLIHEAHSHCKIVVFLCFFVVGPVSVRSSKIGVVGNNWLVGNAVFSETALRIFLIFYIKIGDYKGRKVTELDF